MSFVFVVTYVICVVVLLFLALLLLGCLCRCLCLHTTNTHQTPLTLKKSTSRKLGGVDVGICRSFICFVGGVFVSFFVWVCKLDTNIYNDKERNK